ncbi:DNA polymerase III subunit beta [Kibdelosporangium philippinense]|uniref:DNA polymerase III subunit beta n=1 Tax=Kibdelosporangium philippinense TaxID=211113 RepID=A0ABS8ZKV7_9PSEU|nr:DNA polymerase III subunit beta [Kibdelosporangium philippinense]MCE7007083.1 DNA polymerase III subunit beta [Kibdelosporangium philippinense]
MTITDHTLTGRGTQLGFTTERAALVDALTTVGLAVPKRPVVPLLGGVLLRARDDHLTVSATDYDTTITVPLSGTVRSAGILLVDHAELVRLLGALVKGTRKRDADMLPVTVRTLDDDTPVVDLAGYTVPVTAYAAEDYPAIPDVVSAIAQVDREAFTRDVARIMVAVGKDDVLPALTCINLETTPGTVTMAATDRYRLAVASLPAVSLAHSAKDVSALVPGEVVAATARRFTGDQVRIGFDSMCNPDTVSFVCGDITMSVRTICGDFPTYRILIPSEAAATVQFDRAELLAATRRAAAVLDAKHPEFKRVAVTVTRESVSVAPVLDQHTDAVAAPEQSATVNGITDTARFLFNPAYLADALDSFAGDTVTLHTHSSIARPVLFTDDADGLANVTAFKHVVVPMYEPRT